MRTVLYFITSSRGISHLETFIIVISFFYNSTASEKNSLLSFSDEPRYFCVAKVHCKICYQDLKQMQTAPPTIYLLAGLKTEIISYIGKETFYRVLNLNTSCLFLDFLDSNGLQENDSLIFEVFNDPKVSLVFLLIFKGLQEYGLISVVTHVPVTYKKSDHTFHDLERSTNQIFCLQSKTYYKNTIFLISTNIYHTLL